MPSLMPHLIPTPLEPAALMEQINKAPELASLRSINSALGDLLKVEMGVTSQIAEIIRRDPSLTARLLRLVNSALFGLTQPINGIEEAVFYLGLRQIRQLALATPVIEDLHGLAKGLDEDLWDKLWQHSLASAILTREILALVGSEYSDEMDYILGLVHNIGEIVIASLFPKHFAAILKRQAEEKGPLYLYERDILGWDHAQVGAYYLKRHGLAEELIEATAFQLEPELGGAYKKSAAAVQVADALTRATGLLGLETTAILDQTEWTKLSGWKILFGENEEDYPLVVASLKYSLERLPTLLKGML